MKIGIDFGSTYSVISAYNDAEERVEILTLAEDDSASIPSVVSVNRNGKVTCGKGAKEQMGKRSVRLFEAFKMLLPETNTDMLRKRGYDDIYSPRRVTKDYLESVLHGILNRYGGDKFEDVVICVPEIWGKNLRTLDGRSILREILTGKDSSGTEIADGIDIPVGAVRVVTEPEAASAFFAYNFEKETGKNFNGHLLLIDYGGGTLDITLTEVTSERQGVMEIGYREGGGAGENHPDSGGDGTIGSAGIAFMQDVVKNAIRNSGIVAEDEYIGYTSPGFASAVRDLESQLKAPDRIKEIEDTFGEYGSYYQDYEAILEEDPIEFYEIEYNNEPIAVTYQQLYTSYKNVIEGVLNEQIKQINKKVSEHLGSDPTQPEAGVRNDFKIALVGGFGSFYLVKKQIEEIYNIDLNDKLDMRTKNIAANKREQAISLGAALIAAGKIDLQKTARYSIGIYAPRSDGVYELHYGIKYHQTIEPGRPYFICNSDTDSDTPANRSTYGRLNGEIKNFAIEFTERTNHGGLMVLKREMLEQLKALPEHGFWNCGFSMDESDIVSFHVVPSHMMKGKNVKPLVIPLGSYSKMFDLTDVKEIFV